MLKETIQAIENEIEYTNEKIRDNTGVTAEQWLAQRDMLIEEMTDYVIQLEDEKLAFDAFLDDILEEAGLLPVNEGYTQRLNHIEAWRREDALEGALQLSNELVDLLGDERFRLNLHDDGSSEEFSVYDEELEYLEDRQMRMTNEIRRITKNIKESEGK